MPMTDRTMQLSGGWMDATTCAEADLGLSFHRRIHLRADGHARPGVQTDTYTDSRLAFSNDLLLLDPDDQDGVDQPAGRGIPHHPRLTAPHLSAEEFSGRLVVGARGLLTEQRVRSWQTGAVSAEVITCSDDDDQLAAHRDLVASAHERTSLEVRSGTATT